MNQSRISLQYHEPMTLRDLYRSRIKRRPRLSVAYENKNIKERISAALIHNNAALNRSTVRQNCTRSQTKKTTTVHLNLKSASEIYSPVYYSVFKLKVSIFQCSPNAPSSMRHQKKTVNDSMTFETCLFCC